MFSIISSDIHVYGVFKGKITIQDFFANFDV